MKKLFLIFALVLLPSLAWAQCTGVFPPNTLCGNLSGSPAPPSAFSSGGGVFGPGTTVVNDLAVWNNTVGTLLKDVPVSSLLTAAGFATRAAAIAATISATTTSITIAGYSAANDGGGGQYNRLSGTPSPVKAWHFQSADGAYWQLATSIVVPRQVGAVLDGTTNDTTAIQAWVDYGTTFGVTSYGQIGVAAIPTLAINLPSNAVIDGGNVLTILRSANIATSLMSCATNNNIVVRNLTLNTTAGFGSASTVTFSSGAQTFTVPAGLGLVVNDFIQIAAVSNPTQYEIAQITSYSGTTLVATGSTVVGTGTFSNWYLDLYPHNGDLADGNNALRFTTCNNILVENNKITNRFYNGLDSRNGSNVYFDHNSVTGHVNRGIHMASYVSGTYTNVQATFNNVVGNNFSQYCINTSASDGAFQNRTIIHGNQMVGCLFQGISVNGGMTYTEISQNTATMPQNTTGSAGILVEDLNGTIHEFASHVTVVGNIVSASFTGINVLNTTYGSVIGNSVTGANIGFNIVGQTAASTAYITFSGNVADNCVTDGFDFVGSVAGGVTGLAINGNSSIGNAGNGFLVDGNTSNFAIVGNVSLANGTAYTVAGTGHVNANNK